MNLPAIVAFAAVALSAPAVWAQSRPQPQVPRGESSNGLRLGVTVLPASGEKSTVFEVSIENDGTKDFVLNLGTMLRAGQVGAALMAFWIGTTESATVPFVVSNP